MVNSALMLSLSVRLGLKTKQVDYTLAFIHSKLPENEKVFMRIPCIYHKPGKSIEDNKHRVLKLNRSIYELAQSPLNWFKRLKRGLEHRGFKPSKMDPCLFISKQVLCLVYVDDCLFFARDEADIDKAI